MNPLFVAKPSASSIATALKLWPELSGKRIRPLLISAFGDIYVEASTGEVLVADPLELCCEQVASSVRELEALFADTEWAQEQLLTELVLLAQERGKFRPEAQVFAIAPHPIWSGTIRVESLVPMDLEVWHDICAQIRAQTRSSPTAGC